MAMVSAEVAVEVTVEEAVAVMVSAEEAVAAMISVEEAMVVMISLEVVAEEAVVAIVLPPPNIGIKFKTCDLCHYTTRRFLLYVD